MNTNTTSFIDLSQYEWIDCTTNYAREVESLIVALAESNNLPTETKD
jgi:hypothetical protein